MYGKTPFKISFVNLGGKNHVEFQYQLSSGSIEKEHILLWDFSYRIEQESTQLKLINHKGSFWDGFSFEDKEKLEMFIENKKLIEREKFSISDFIEFKKKRDE